MEPLFVLLRAANKFRMWYERFDFERRIKLNVWGQAPQCFDEFR